MRMDRFSEGPNLRMGYGNYDPYPEDDDDEEETDEGITPEQRQAALKLLIYARKLDAQKNSTQPQEGVQPPGSEPKA